MKDLTAKKNTKKSSLNKFLIPGIVVAVAVVILVNLGFWQLERLQWKQGLLAGIEAQKAVDASQVALAKDVESYNANLHRGYLTGIWITKNNIKIGPETMNGQLGYWIVTPLSLNNGKLVLVNRGWAPNNKVLMLMDSTPPAGVTTVIGTLRASDTKASMAGDDAKSWHGLSVQGIAEGNSLSNVAQMALFMESSVPADDSTLIPAPVFAELRNDHLAYAIFWFTAAGVVLALSLFALVRALNLPKKR